MWQIFNESGDWRFDFQCGSQHGSQKFFTMGKKDFFVCVPYTICSMAQYALPLFFFKSRIIVCRVHSFSPCSTPFVQYVSDLHAFQLHLSSTHWINVIFQQISLTENSQTVIVTTAGRFLFHLSPRRSNMPRWICKANWGREEIRLSHHAYQAGALCLQLTQARKVERLISREQIKCA